MLDKLLNLLLELWGTIEAPAKAILAIVSGGAIWEAFKFFWPELKRPFDEKRLAKKSFYKNLDPILKSASELYGKMESLAKEDFSSFRNPENSNSIDPKHNRNYVFYLFAQFWAQLEYLRLESQYTSLSKIKKGSELLRFIETLESRKYRVLDRSIQRIIGEALITNNDQKFRILTLKEFLDELEKTESSLSKWVKRLESLTNQLNDKEVRQIFLIFGIIVGMLIDHFDPEYKTVRRRNIYTNKLSRRSKQLIRNNLLKHYLPFINKGERYY